MLQETEFWRLEVVPRYVRKPYTKLYEKIECGCSDPEHMGFTPANDPHCYKCRGYGSYEKDVTPPPPAPPEISLEYIEHMRKAHKEFFSK